MSDLRIKPVDPADAAQFRPYYEVYAAALRHGPNAEHSTIWQLEEIRVSMSDPDPRTFRLGWTGTVDGTAVATGWVQGSTVDNTDLLEVLVCCAPEHRGRGYARAVLARVEDEARERGRTRLLGEVAWPYPDGPEGAGSPDLAWAKRQGFEVALLDVQRRLTLPVPEEHLDALAAEAAAHHAGYTLRSFTGPVPDDLAEGWVALSATLMTEAPMGEVEREVEVADVGRLRAEEAMLQKQGRTKVHTAALAPDGELVAYTEIAVTAHESDRAYQWGTLVRPDHRGHRLGLAVKVANLRLLQEAHPDLRTVVTYNADVNAPMVSVNERLGFRPVQWMAEVQRRL